MSYRIIREDQRPARTQGIDYERMNRVLPEQAMERDKAASERDVVKLANLCIEHARVWDEIGAWPDDWSGWQRALDDLLHWRDRVDLDDLVSGRVRIEATP